MEEAIVAILKAASSVTALCASRIYPNGLPQGRKLPAIAVLRTGGAALTADDGETGLTDGRLQVECHGKDWTAAKALGRAARAALSEYSGTIAGVTLHLVSVESEDDAREGGSGNAEYPHFVTLDLQVWAAL